MNTAIAPEDQPTIQIPAVKRLTHGQRIMKLAGDDLASMTLVTANEIVAIRRQARKSWDVLHIPVEVARRVKELLRAERSNRW